MHVPAGDAVGLVAEQAGDRRLVIAEIGGKTGEAVAQHMRRDIGWQITELGDPQPHLAIADDRRPTLDSSTVSGMLKLTAIRAHTDPRNVVRDFTAGSQLR